MTIVTHHYTPGTVAVLAEQIAVAAVHAHDGEGLRLAVTLKLEKLERIALAAIEAAIAAPIALLRSPVPLLAEDEERHIREAVLKHLAESGDET